jgi:hypothetical protein
MNILKISFLILFLGLMFTACFKPPTYPDTPAIDFVSIRNSSASNFADSVIVIISYRDGNGDLGLNSSDNQPPFQDSPSNPFYHNFFINAYKRVNGRYSLITFPDGVTLNGRFPRLSDSRNSAIEGTVQFTFAFFYAGLVSTTPRISRNDTVKFDVQIADRALNRSNIVETQEIIVGRR